MDWIIRDSHKINKLLFLTISFFSFSSMAVVDMRNANFSDTWLDHQLPGTGYQMQIQRTYNSRTLFNGIFGFGWCSSFETKLLPTLEGTIRLRECGGGQEVVYQPKGYSKTDLQKSIDFILKEIKKRNPKMDATAVSNLAKELADDAFLRDEIQTRLGVKVEIKKGQNYVTDGRENENINFNGEYYKRTLTDGTHERYDTQGRLTAMYDKAGSYLKVTYKGDQIVSIIDNNGRAFNFNYFENNKKVRQIKAPGNLVAEYTYKGEDLASAKNAWGELQKFEYDDLHNLTKIKFNDNTTKELQYNKDRDWVMGFKDRKNCSEKYGYESDAKDPINHYWSTVVKTCGKEVTNRSRYEFWHAMKKDGNRYLEKTRSDVNGKVSMTVYHPQFGRPTYVARNNTVTTFEYFNDGLLKLRKEDAKSTNFEYKNTCKKISKIVAQFFGIDPAELQRRKPAQTKKKLVKTLTTGFKYNEKCNVSYAENTDGQSAELNYDQRGRISKIKDQSKKLVTIEYEEKFGKPSVVNRPGVGAMTVLYKDTGEIKDVKSKEGPVVAAQVASIFNNLLELIAPATSDLEI